MLVHLINTTKAYFITSRIVSTYNFTNILYTFILVYTLVLTITTI